MCKPQTIPIALGTNTLTRVAQKARHRARLDRSARSWAIKYDDAYKRVLAESLASLIARYGLEEALRFLYRFADEILSEVIPGTTLGLFPQASAMEPWEPSRDLADSSQIDCFLKADFNSIISEANPLECLYEEWVNGGWEYPDCATELDTLRVIVSNEVTAFLPAWERDAFIKDYKAGIKADIASPDEDTHPEEQFAAIERNLNYNPDYNNW